MASGIRTTETTASMGCSAGAGWSLDGMYPLEVFVEDERDEWIREIIVYFYEGHMEAQWINRENSLGYTGFDGSVEMPQPG